MYFQSYAFLFAFLPLVVVVHQWLARLKEGTVWRNWFLAFASIFFYAYLSPTALPFLAGTCVYNFWVGKRILAARQASDRPAGLWLALGIAINCAALATFKYSDALGLTGQPLHYFPVGASFITFIQIIYLVETFNGTLRPLSISDYLRFATFFGYITSGPVVSANEVIARDAGSNFEGTSQVGIMLPAVALLAIGLFKKLVVADPLAPYAGLVFSAAEGGYPVSISDAWTGALLYMLQLYFDFSGYSDMAIAIGCMFGMQLPLNFNSPFKSTNVMDYWRRWHMTLTRFITNYLYLPIAVSMTRRLRGRSTAGNLSRFLLTVAVPTIAAFLIAGVWHGTGWTFFYYGLYWGLALCIYQAWTRISTVRIPMPLAWVLTIATVLGSLVIFRSPSIETAATVLTSAFGAGSVAPDRLPGWTTLLALSLLAALVVLPNSQQLLSRFRLTADDVEPLGARWAWLAWSPNAAGAAALGVILSIALLMGGGPTQFLYYRF